MHEIVRNSLILLLPFSCLIILSSSYAILLRKNFSETIFLSIATIILILFLSGLLNFKGSLLFGYFLIISLTFLFFIFLTYKFITERKCIKEISFFPGIIILISFLMISLYLNYGRLFSIWDEFSHWGSVLKNMYSLDALGTFHKASGVIVKSYPPATSLFQYFWIRPFPTFTEFPAYIASNMLFFSLLSIFLKKNLRNIIFLTAGILIPLLIEPTFYSSLYVDSLIGILFGVIILSYYYIPDKNLVFKIIIFSSLTSILILTKDMGFILAGIAYCIIFGDLLFFKFRKLRNIIKKEKASKTIYIFLLFLLPIFLKLLWNGHLRLTMTNSILNQKSIDINNFINNNFLPYQHQTLSNFIEAIGESPLVPLELTVLNLLFLIVPFFIVLTLLRKTNQIRWERLFFALFSIIIGFGLYSFLILITYLFLFSEYEATILASYSRYHLSYIIAIFYIFNIFILLESNKIKDKLKQIPLITLKSVLSCLLITFLLYSLVSEIQDPFDSEILDAKVSIQKTLDIRNKYEDILIWNDYFIEDEHELYIISQGDRGLDYIIILYTLYPTHLQWKWDYSVGLEPYYPELDDPWTMIITPEDWSKYVIDNYERLYIFKYDEKFEQIYGHFFDEVKNNSFYEVTVNGNGVLELKSLPLP